MVVHKDMVKEILYYTDNILDGTRINDLTKEYIEKSKLPILSVSLKPIEFGRNIHFKGLRRQSTLYKQILTGLKASQADVMFFCEHDVLYHESHWEFSPPTDDRYYYNNNVYKYRLKDRKVITYDCSWLSQLCANRELLIEHYTKRLDMIAKGQRAYGYEPGTGQSRNIDNVPAENWDSEHPNIDIRHGKNLTGVMRMNPKEFRNKKNCQNFRETTVEGISGWDKELLLSI